MSLTRWTGIARKFPSPIYKFVAQNYIDYKFPRHIFIETTANCNLSCAYCPREKRQDNMDFNLFKEIINECRNYGSRSFSLHLFGEPLMYPKILEAIRYIKKQNRRNTILLTTNGTFLNKFIDNLVELRVDRIIWSWRRNNFTDETIRKLRKHGGFVRILLEETPKEEIEKWKNFPRLEVKHLHNYGGNINTSKWHDNKLPDRYPCYHLWLAPAIRWNGEIIECCNIPKLGSEVFGIYGKNSIHEIWNGDRIKTLRESHLRNLYPGVCKNCDSWQAYPDIFFNFQKKKDHL